jgi:cell division protein FtsQ
MNQGNTTSRPLIWEDEAPADSRFRRMQQGVPRTGRALPGMPLEMQDPDGDEPSRPKRPLFGAAPAHWWWPASTVGRTLLALTAVCVLAGLTTAGDLLKTYVERDSRFRIAGTSQIQATGLTEVSRSQMLPVFGEDIGRNIFFVPIAQRRKELEAIPWVEHATVMRLLPDQIRINVVERQPVAFTRHGQQIGLVDASGVLLDMSPATMAAHHYSFPVVTGIDPGDRPEARQARMAVYSRLMAELDANNQHYSEQISEIDLTDPENARVLIPAQGSDILADFGEDHFLERYQRYQAHIAEWRQQYPKLAAVDLRYDHQVVLEMASGVDATQPAADSSSAAKPSADGQLTSAQSETKPAATNPSAKSSPAKTAAGKSALEKAVKEKTKAKSSTSTSAKARAAAAKKKTAQEKKRAQAKAAALKSTKRKPSPDKRPSAAQGL